MSGKHEPWEALNGGIYDSQGRFIVDCLDDDALAERIALEHNARAKSDELKATLISFFDDLTRNLISWDAHRLGKMIARGEAILEILEGE